MFRTRVSPDIEDAETLIAELEAIDPPSNPPMDLFDAHFADPNLIATTEFIVATPAGVIAACSEARADGMIEADCSGMPMLHLLLITFNGLRVSAITHLNSTSTAFPNAVLMSRGGALASHAVMLNLFQHPWSGLAGGPDSTGALRP